MTRRKVSAPYNDFVKETDSILRLDGINQQRLGVVRGSNPQGLINKQQLHLLTESSFFSAFRAFENFVEDVFILCLLEKPSIANKRPKSYLKPKDFRHARELLKSSQKYLDWTSPQTLIERSERYLADGEPFKTVIASNQKDIQNMKRIRNHIAHNSDESSQDYRKVVRDINSGTLPLTIPPPGELLLQIAPRTQPSQHYLVFYIARLREVAKAIVH